MRPQIIEFTEIPITASILYIENYPWHWHEAMEIILVLEGSVNVSIGDENLLYQKNDIAIVNSNELHRITKSESDNKIMILHIDFGFYKKNIPENKFSYLYCCFAFYGDKKPDKYRILNEYIQDLYKIISDKSKKTNLANIKSSLSTLLHYISYNFDFLRWGFGDIAFDERHVQRLKQIGENILSKQDSYPGLKELAAEVNLSLYHLSHDIKNKFGQTFQNLLFYTSIERAAKLLLSTEQRIVDIAMECKFSDPKYLIKHFKYHFGYTPSEFRKLICCAN